MVDYCKVQHNDIPKIFSMLQAFNSRASYDFSFLRNFYKYYISENYSIILKREIFKYFLDFCENDAYSLRMKVNASYLIIYPIIIKNIDQHK